MIELDKVAHFFFSFLIGQFSPLLAVFAGIGKEIFDVARGGMADAGDLVADALGILLALLVLP